MWSLLLVLGVAFVGYAVYANYNRTSAEASVPARVWASVVAAVASFGTWIAVYLKNPAALP